MTRDSPTVEQEAERLATLLTREVFDARKTQGADWSAGALPFTRVFLALREALADLECEQNGAPLLTREEAWQDAMAATGTALSAADALLAGVDGRGEKL